MSNGRRQKAEGCVQNLRFAQAGRLATSVPFFLAGGLSPENAGVAVRDVSPFGLDVSSGVETAGLGKDPQKIQAFIGEAKAMMQSKI